jgi:VCBS repeat protein/K319-like protein
VADFNSDGKADLAMLSRASRGIMLLPGHGDGTFGPGIGMVPISGIGSSISAVAMVTADFNRDGKPDLAVGNRRDDDVLASGTVSLFLGTGNLDFTQEENVLTPSGIMDLVAADLDGDGKPDLATTNAGQSFSIALGRGDGTFQALGDIPAEPDFVYGLIAGDFNSDGRIDLAATDVDYGNILVLPGRGDGTFDPPLRSAAGQFPSSLVSGDFDGDGRIDLATTDGRESVAVLPGHGDGTFGPFSRSPVGGCPQSVAAGDFNRDGKPDLATANSGSSDISVRLGLGDGSFGSESRIPLPGVPPGHRMPRTLVSADFNRDGNADLATAPVGLPYPVFGGIFILPGLGNGSFAAPTLVPWTGTSLLAVDDFNKDGIPDLASTRNAPFPAVFLGLGDGTFVPPAGGGGVPPDMVQVRSLAVGDLDGDGNPDAFIGTGFIPRLSVFRGRGDGTFEGLDLSNIYGLPADASAVAAAEIDGDRRLDLMVAEIGANDVQLLSNIGGGMLAPAGRFLAGLAPTALVAVDLDGDGWADLVTANIQGNDVVVMLSRGRAIHDRPPVADAGADVTRECAPPPGTQVLLDGSGSSDPDSTPGTTDDIVSFEWFEGYGGSSPVLLGTGVKLTATLQVGTHTITLKVTDRSGASATDTVTVTVVDTTPPFESVSVSPAFLWPPDGQMVEIRATVSGGDLCTPASLALESIVESDSGGGGTGAGDIQGADFGTPDLVFSLKAARNGKGPGRVYTITYRATDGSGNVTRRSATVLVPHTPQSGASASRRWSGGASRVRGTGPAHPADPSP